MPSQQDLVSAGADGIVISPQALYQPDPLFLQKLQNQLMQRFPSVEFVPYPADLPTPVQSQPQNHAHSQLFLLENEDITRQTPSAFEPPKNVVQRQTHESTVVTLVPQTLVVGNETENQIEVVSASDPQNVTLELLAAESQPGTTTIKYVIEQKEPQEQSTTPLYYAQIGQSVENVVANGFYSALNDVRAAAALAQMEKPQEQALQVENVTTTTINPDLKTYFVQNADVPQVQNITELKPLLGVPFSKAADSVNIAYTLLRTSDKEPKVTQEGAVYAGQIVEATISEDHDFNKEKETLISRRAPLRLFTVTEKKDAIPTTTPPPTQPPSKFTVVKARIPPKSKLTFDDKTGEPVLRIYASYVDSPLQVNYYFL